MAKREVLEVRKRMGKGKDLFVLIEILTAILTCFSLA